MADEISAAELEELIEDGEDVRIVDIRSPEAFRRGRLPDSENIPFSELADRIDELEGAERVVTVCPRGEASVQAARLIASYEEFDGRVESLSSGVEGWGTPLEADDTDDSETEEAPF